MNRLHFALPRIRPYLTSYFSSFGLVMRKPDLYCFGKGHVDLGELLHFQCSILLTVLRSVTYTFLVLTLISCKQSRPRSESILFAVAFTDGSCLGNPGPCGAGASILVPGEDEPVLLKQPVSNKGSILLGELIAIKMALVYIQEAYGRTPKGSIKKIQLFSDSQSAIGLLTLGWVADTHKATILECKAIIGKVLDSGVEVSISWSPGHADIRGNEQADLLAKAAATEARNMGDELPIVTTLTDIKSAATKSVQMKWQDRWSRSETGRHLFQFRPKVGFNVKHKFQMPATARVIIQLRTGYSALKEYRQKTGVSDSDECECGGRETVSHFLLECPILEEEREIMRRRLFQYYGVINLDLNALLDARSDDEHKFMRSMILQELEMFVVNSKRFATAQSQ